MNFSSAVHFGYSVNSAETSAGGEQTGLDSEGLLHYGFVDFQDYGTLYDALAKLDDAGII